MYTCRLNYTPPVPDGFTQIVTGRPIVFPNPFANQLTVSSESEVILQVSVFDLMGRELDATVNYQGRSATVLPSASTAGFFVVKIKTQHGVETFPVTRMN
jgi:hypothetical protein